MATPIYPTVIKLQHPLKNSEGTLKKSTIPNFLEKDNFKTYVGVQDLCVRSIKVIRNVDNTLTYVYREPSAEKETPG